MLNCRITVREPFIIRKELYHHTATGVEERMAICPFLLGIQGARKALDFELIHVDYRTLERTPKNSFY